MMIGAEVGHSWFSGKTIMDLSAYGRLVDNLSQNPGIVQVSDSLGPLQSLSGLRESDFGADAGATLSAKLSDAVRLYVLYEGRYRSNFTSHSATAGAEFRF